MTEPTASSPSQPLQFDRAVDPASPPADGTAAGITCSRCSAAITTYYYHLDGETVCASCKQTAERSGATQKSGGAFLRAGVLGFGAALLGAAIYYAVIAITNLEIGLVAILIGFLVGAAVRKGARGGGGRRYQIMAVALTYFSVGLAYSPLAFKGFAEGARTRADSVAAANPGSADSLSAAAAGDSVSAETTAAATQASIGFVGLGIALGATFLLIFVLPIMAVVGSMPSGLISALIIGFGMHQAWQMTGGHKSTITGPYRVGGTAPPAPEPSAG
jgi:hypothetical protein